VLVLAACGDDGVVYLQLDLPADPALDPFDDRLADLTLTASAGGEQLLSTTTVAGDGRLELGQVPVAEQVSFELAGRARSGRMLAFGRSAPVDVRADAAVDVPMRVRRPSAYVAGDADLAAIDTTLQPGDAYTAAIPIGGAVSAVAAARDGGELVVVADDGLRLVDTRDHVAAAAAVPLMGPAIDLAVSADGAWAVATHGDPTPGVSIVDLAALRSGDPVDATFVTTPAASAVAIGGDRAWVVLDPLDNLFCVGESSILAIPLDDPGSAGPPLALGAPGGDLVVDPGSGDALVALPCASKVVRISDPAGPAVPVAEQPGISAIAVARDRLWMMGHIDGPDAHLILASVPLEGGDLVELDMPTLEERALAVDLAGPGQGGLIQVTADLASAFDMVVLPDDEHVAILVAAVYLTDPSGDAGGGQPILPGITMVTYEYQLVELATGLGAQRLRTYCSLSWDAGALLDDFACALAPGQDQAPTSFQPSDLAALYGAR